MRWTYLKIILREIRHSLGRFLAIFGIVALGVGFLSGLLITTPDMHHSVDAYYDQYNMSDIAIKGTMGLTEEDIEEIRSFDEVNQAMPAYASDVLMVNSKDETMTTRIYGLDLLEESPTINKLQLLEGRFPKNNKECVIERKGGFLNTVPLGSKLAISKENEDYDDIHEIFHTTEYTVVGVVANTYYFSLEREQTQVGSGKLNAIIYADKSAFSMEVFTDLFLTVKNASALDSFSTEYKDAVKPLAKELEAFGKERSLLRHDEILKEAKDKLQEGIDAYDQGKLQADAQLDYAKKELDKGKKELSDALKNLENGKIEIYNSRQTLDKETRKAKSDIRSGRAKLQEAREELKKGEQELLLALSKLKEGEKEYQTGLKKYSDSKQELEAAQRKLEAGERDYNRGLAKLKQSKEEIRASDGQLLRAEQELAEGERQYNMGRLELQKQKSAFFASFEPALANTPFKSAEELLTAFDAGDEHAIQIIGEISKNPQFPKELIVSTWEQIKEAEKQLALSRHALDAGKSEVLEGKRKLAQGKMEVQKAELQLSAAKLELDKNRPALASAWVELDRGKKVLDQSKIELDKGFKEYRLGQEKINQGWTDYYDGSKELDKAETQLGTETRNAKKKLSNAEKDLAEGRSRYDEGLKTLKKSEAKYLEAKEKAEEELLDTKKELDDAKKEIDELEMPKWYVLDRNSNMSYASFVMNADKVAAIAKVFPVFFYLIAALVALTTMTRMVEEERLQLGTLKSLGYSKAVIISKYIVYSGLASILGSIFGVMVGISVMPYVIWNAYGVMYHLPDFTTQFDAKIVFLASGMAIVSTLASTIYAVSNSLKEKPAALMQPKAPAAGKRILLEHVSLIWSKMTFNQKATARNLFRYKKHFYMTIIGIGGCTALLMAGFGLRDSISTVIDTQFFKVFQYDIVLDLDGDKKANADLNSFLEDPAHIEAFSPVFKEKAELKHQDDSYDSTIFVPLEPSSISHFIVLKNRKTQEEYQFSPASVIVTEKIAETLHLGAGDKIVLENEDGAVFEFTITGITENYLGNYVYVSRELYEQSAHAKAAANSFLVNTPYEETQRQEQLISDLLSFDNVFSAELVSGSKATFENLLHSINYIVIVIIVASGMLAFIVLYNLTNININERKKELATLKVLGFYNNEVAGYIFRETIILTLIGTGFGLLLGRIFHKFIVFTIENIDFMFGRRVFFASYLLSAVITLLFSLIVNIFMYKKIKGIEMVESMKAVD